MKQLNARVVEKRQQQEEIKSGSESINARKGIKTK